MSCVQQQRQNEVQILAISESIFFLDFKQFTADLSETNTENS